MGGLVTHDAGGRRGGPGARPVLPWTTWATHDFLIYFSDFVTCFSTLWSISRNRSKSVRGVPGRSTRRPGHAVVAGTRAGQVALGQPARSPTL